MAKTIAIETDERYPEFLWAAEGGRFFDTAREYGQVVEVTDEEFERLEHAAAEANWARSFLRNKYGWED